MYLANWRYLPYLYLSHLSINHPSEEEEEEEDEGQARSYSTNVHTVSMADRTLYRIQMYFRTEISSALALPLACPRRY